MNDTRPKDMGTTGLIAWVKSHKFGRKRALTRATAIRILKRRGYSGKAIAAFTRLTNEF